MERVGEKQKEMARAIPSKRRRGFVTEREGSVEEDCKSGRRKRVGQWHR